MDKKNFSIHHFAQILEPISSFSRFIKCFDFSKTDFQTVIFCYHSISKYRDMTKNFYYTISPELFNDQMKFLYDNNFNVINLSEWFQLCTNNNESLKNSVIITFDDGYADSFHYAYPILKKHGFSATFFLICNFINSQTIFPWLQEPKFPNNENLPLSSEQIIQMDQDGMDFGSHSLSHTDLTRISKKKAQEEIRGSKEYLEDLLGHDIISFSYPYGSWSNFNSSTKEMVKMTGYKLAVTSIYGSNALHSDLFSLKRFPVYADDNINKFHMKCEGYYSWLGSFQKLMSYVSRLLLKHSS